MWRYYGFCVFVDFPLDVSDKSLTEKPHSLFNKFAGGGRKNRQAAFLPADSTSDTEEIDSDSGRYSFLYEIPVGPRALRNAFKMSIDFQNPHCPSTHVQTSSNYRASSSGSLARIAWRVRTYRPSFQILIIF